MPTKNTTARAVRIPDSILNEVKKRAGKKGITVNAWVNWAIMQGLRPHRPSRAR